MAAKDGTPAAKRQKHADGSYSAPQLRMPVAIVSNMIPSKFAMFVDSNDTLQRMLGEEGGGGTGRRCELAASFARVPQRSWAMEVHGCSYRAVLPVRSLWKQRRAGSAVLRSRRRQHADGRRVAAAGLRCTPSLSANASAASAWSLY